MNQVEKTILNQYFDHLINKAYIDNNIIIKAKSIINRIENETLIEEKYMKWLNLPLDEFKSLMVEYGIMGEKDEVVEYTPNEVANMVYKANGYGYNVSLDMEILHDYYLLSLYDDDNRNCKIFGLSAESDEWIGWFHLDELAENLIKGVETIKKEYKSIILTSDDSTFRGKTLFDFVDVYGINWYTPISVINKQLNMYGIKEIK